MDKKLMLLAAGTMTALALAVLPATASAGEYVALCQTGAQCSATIAGGVTTLSNSEGETISCSSITGTATHTSGTSTTTAQLILHGCRETVTIFKFSCGNTETPGTITTNTTTGHIVNLEHNGTAPGALITGVSLTFTCAGYASKTVTGSIVGKFEDAHCNTFQSSHTVEFTQSSHGRQTYNQVTTTGTIYDLISNNDPATHPAITEYSTASVTGTFTISSNNGNKVNITC
jgi:hypothetical protein